MGSHLRYRRQDFEVLIQNDLLGLQANIHGPLDETSHVSHRLDVMAYLLVLYTLPPEWVEAYRQVLVNTELYFWSA